MEYDAKKFLFLYFKVEWQWKKHGILYILKVDYIN